MRVFYKDHLSIISCEAVVSCLKVITRLRLLEEQIGRFCTYIIVKKTNNIRKLKSVPTNSLLTNRLIHCCCALRVGLIFLYYHSMSKLNTNNERTLTFRLEIRWEEHYSLFMLKAKTNKRWKKALFTCYFHMCIYIEHRKNYKKLNGIRPVLKTIIY